MKASELVEFLKEVPPDTELWFEDDQTFGPVGCVLYSSVLDSLSFIPGNIQASFDHCHEPGHKLLGDPTCVVWTDLADEEDDEYADEDLGAPEGAWVPESKEGPAYATAEDPA